MLMILTDVIFLFISDLIINQRCSLRARLRDSPVLGQIREALMYGEQYCGSNSKSLPLMI